MQSLKYQQTYCCQIVTGPNQARVRYNSTKYLVVSLTIICLGRRFAELEVYILLAKLMQNFRSAALSSENLFIYGSGSHSDTDSDPLHI